LQTIITKSFFKISLCKPWITTAAKYFRHRQQMLKVRFLVRPSFFHPVNVDARLREADDANNRKRVISLIDRLFSGVTVMISPRVNRAGNRIRIGAAGGLSLTERISCAISPLFRSCEQYITVRCTRSSCTYH